jgi:ubiquinone biosynthesis protein
MRISTIPQIYRNVNRLTEILSVLSKYGLADWISRLHLDFAQGLFRDADGEALSRHTREARIRLALSELGPTFIKLGQLLSTRPDLVGHKLAGELQRLQENVPPDPPQSVREAVENELGQPIDELFAEFDNTPLASASIGQVHRAQLHSGQVVVVKVQRQGIQDTVHKDLEVLAGLARMVNGLPEFAPYRPVATVAELQRTLRRELDFGREERNLQQFANRFADNPHVRIPQPVSELCTPRVLTMQLLEGVKLNDEERLKTIGADRDELAQRGAEIYLQMVFRDGHYHADPHPGNVLVIARDTLGLLDFGMVGRLDEPLRERIEEMLWALVSGDAMQLVNALSNLADIPPQIDRGALRVDVADFVADYATQRMDRFSLSDALTEMMEIVFRYRIALYPQVALLIKLLITLEGTLQLLNPRVSLIEMLRPHRRWLLSRRLSPARRMRKLQRLWSEVENLVEFMPRYLLEMAGQIQTGKFEVHLNHRGLEPSVNRLALGLLVSSLFLGSSLMLSMKVPPLLFHLRSFWGLHDLSLLGLVGLVLSVLLALRLLRAINRSGHLGRGEP